MVAHLVALSWDAQDPHRLAGFWGALLSWPIVDQVDGSVLLLPTDDTGFVVRFVPTEHPKTSKNWTHPDLTSESLEAQEQLVARALSLGASHLDVGQSPEAPHVVLADPEGNEFCVIEPGNDFLADCGALGALAGDGTQEVGYFWRDALGWPLVWDQDEETAIRSAAGGPIVSWGGPPVAPKTDRNRLRFDIAAPPEGDQRAEIERLIDLGATLEVHGGGAAVVLKDPDGNEFSVLSAT
jgi:hypothetical protein